MTVIERLNEHGLAIAEMRAAVERACSLPQIVESGVDAELLYAIARVELTATAVLLSFTAREA